VAEKILGGGDIVLFFHIVWVVERRDSVVASVSADGGLGRPVGFWVVLHSPLRGRFMWPLDVAGLGMRYFVTDLMSRCGAPRRKPASIAMMRDDFGGFPRLWCMNVTALAFVVRWYEKVAMSVAAAGDNGA